MRINLPKTKHVAGDLRVSVVKIIRTHRSPSVVVQDLKTSGIMQTVVTSKSNPHYTEQPQSILNTQYKRKIWLESICSRKLYIQNRAACIACIAV